MYSDFTRANKTFCNILVHACFLRIYSMTEPVQAIEGTGFGL